jgi:hypothetical protein
MASMYEEDEVNDDEDDEELAVVDAPLCGCDGEGFAVEVLLAAGCFDELAEGAACEST